MHAARKRVPPPHVNWQAVPQAPLPHRLPLPLPLSTPSCQADIQNAHTPGPGMKPTLILSITALHLLLLLLLFIFLLLHILHVLILQHGARLDPMAGRQAHMTDRQAGRHA